MREVVVVAVVVGVIHETLFGVISFCSRSRI